MSNVSNYALYTQAKFPPAKNFILFNYNRLAEKTKKMLLRVLTLY